MTDPINLMDIASDFVKIGSGALIGGLLAVFGDSRKFRRERKAALTDYERNMLKDIVTEFGNFYTFASGHCYDLYLYSFNLKTDEASSKVRTKDIAQLNAAKDEIYSRHSVIVKIYNELLLIGARKPANRLKDLDDVLFEMFPPPELKDDNLKDVNVDGLLENLRIMREKFIEDLGDVFKRM